MSESHPDMRQPRPKRATRSSFRYLLSGLGRILLSNKLPLLLFVGTVIVGSVTYNALSESAEQAIELSEDVIPLLYVNLAMLMLFAAVILQRIIVGWVRKRRGASGTRLYLRLIAAFSAVAIVPVAIVGISSVFFMQLGVESWFSDRVRTAIYDAEVVAKDYLETTRRDIFSSALSLAAQLNQNPQLSSMPQRLNEILQAESTDLNLIEVVVFDGRNKVVGRGGLTLALELEFLSEDAIEQVRRSRRGEPVLLQSESADRVRSVIRLERWFDHYLLVGRLVGQEVLSNIDNVSRASADYRALESKRAEIQLLVAAIFSGLAMVLLLGAVSFGIAIAERIAGPVGRFISAAELVRAGDLSARLKLSEREDDLNDLARAFNRMTAQLDRQRSELIAANRQLEARRQFTEAVLSGVSAGVLGLDAEGRITLANGAAQEMLLPKKQADEEQAAERLEMHHVGEVMPQILPLLTRVRVKPQQMQQAEIEVTTGHETRHLFIRITAEHEGEEIHGYVLTCDDVSDLIQAQRKAAWADVARRIAHEIKNPLTPIQLSAERLKRKYRTQIKDDPDIFDTCIETIIRQVGGVRRMVDEFSTFARMPNPVMREESLNELAKHSCFLMRQSHPQITVVLEESPEDFRAICDSRMIGQAITNVVKNAVEAIEGEQENAASHTGKVTVSLAREGEEISIMVRDNGPGLPEGLSRALTEPYVTTKSKGTGLGLAIVKKIMEDHHGQFELSNHPEGGALARLSLPQAVQRDRQVEPNSADDA